MKMTITALLTTSILCACATTTKYRVKSDCDFGDIKITANFEGARLNGCGQAPDGRIELTIKPENTPINNSAWYGFDIEGGQGKMIDLALVYKDGKHRYVPKIFTHDAWEIFDKKIHLSTDEKRAEFTIMPAKDSVRIAAQPVFDLAVHKTWIDKAAKLDFVTLSEIGQSVEKRPLFKLEEVDSPNSAKPYVVIIGRQHPPETTGALALMPFVDTVWGDSTLAKTFRSEFNLIVLPALNPDGVVRGHWRHNVNGIDLNRDWGPFTQPETQAAARELNRFKSGKDEMVLFLDFHSTWRNLIYTQTDAEPSEPEFFTRDWIKNVKARLPDDVYSFTREANKTTDRPVSKNYIYRSYNIPAMTFEVGDKTPVKNINIAGEVFAQEVMRLLLSRANETKTKAEGIN